MCKIGASICATFTVLFVSMWKCRRSLCRSGPSWLIGGVGKPSCQKALRVHRKKLQPFCFLTRELSNSSRRLLDAVPCQAAARLLQESLALYGFWSWDSHEFAAAICQQLQPVHIWGGSVAIPAVSFNRNLLILKEADARILYSVHFHINRQPKRYGAADSFLALRQRTESVKGTMKGYCAFERCKWQFQD